MPFKTAPKHGDRYLHSGATIDTTPSRFLYVNVEDGGENDAVEVGILGGIIYHIKGTADDHVGIDSTTMFRIGINTFPVPLAAPGATG